MLTIQGQAFADSSEPPTILAPVGPPHVVKPGVMLSVRSKNPGEAQDASRFPVGPEAPELPVASEPLVPVVPVPLVPPVVPVVPVVPKEIVYASL